MFTFNKLISLHKQNDHALCFFLGWPNVAPRGLTDLLFLYYYS